MIRPKCTRPFVILAPVQHTTSYVYCSWSPSSPSGTHDLLQRVVQFLLMVSVITLKCTFRFLMLQKTTQADRNLEGML